MNGMRTQHAQIVLGNDVQEDPLVYFSLQCKYTVEC